MKFKRNIVTSVIVSIYVFAIFILLNFIENVFSKKKPLFYQYKPSEMINTKTILFWHPFFSDRDYNFGFGNTPFFYNGCEVTDCYTTENKSMLSVDQFDVIVFHGPYLHSSAFPKQRSPHQVYVYFNMESPQNHPVEARLDGVFNLTMTYRLDSDIQLPYFQMADLSNNIISPSLNPDWVEPFFDRSVINQTAIESKKKPVAWFSSNCNSKNGRERFVKQLQLYISVDVFGYCGDYSCPRTDEQACFDMLSRDYFFYLAFENSNCVDYVTEKVLTALEHDVVPVIFGGANITRYLPPGSYIDARNVSPPELASTLDFLMRNPSHYAAYFWWKGFYKVGFSAPPLCELCKVLHDANFKPKTYKNLQEWWHGTKNDPYCRM